MASRASQQLQSWSLVNLFPPCEMYSVKLGMVFPLYARCALLICFLLCVWLAGGSGCALGGMALCVGGAGSFGGGLFGPGVSVESSESLMLSSDSLIEVDGGRWLWG